MKKTFITARLVIIGLLLAQFANAQQLAFPGAEGFGKYTVGGRGGTVYHVTNLNDSGSGSFRDAVSQPYRTVVFDVGGVINISSRIVIQHHVTVAGQTAPGGGITIYGNGIALNGDSGDNIIRYIRIRMGKNGDSGKDAVSISEGQNYIFDHVSISWGRDGTLDVNGTGIDNLTFQDCIIGQGINNSNHSTGGLMQSGKWSMIRSLYIDNKTRNPKARGTHEFINSVLYNWGTNGYIMGDTEGLSECNLIGNYFIYGPSSSSNTHITNTTASFHVYASDNWVDSDKDGNLDGSLLTNYNTATVESTPYNYPGVSNVMSAQDALNHVIQNVGASVSRDAVDQFLINQLTSYGTSGQIINTEDDNGIPNNVGTVANGTPPTDSDGDGMSNSWESANGTNPNSADNNGDVDGDGYTNIEEYIDWIVNGSTTAPAELIKQGAGSSSQSITLGESIVSFYYNWANATGVNVTGLPSGVNASINTGSQSVTISGTPTSTGTYQYTITTTGGSPNTSVNGTITVSSGSGSSVTIEENTTGFCSVDGSVDNNNAGFTGSGFANTNNAAGNGVDWKINFSSSGNKTFTFRYASTSNRPANLIVNGGTVASNISFLSTGSWTTWTTVSVNANTSAGIYDVRLEATGSSGLGNIDNITVTDASAASCSSTPVTYTLSTSVSGQGSVNPSGGTYNSGQVVSVTATPSSGWQFTGWSGAASGSTNPVNITMDANKSLTASFTQITTTTITIQENTTGFCSVDGTVDNNNAGFTGSGFANTSNATGMGISWSVNIPSSGSYTLGWQFANGGSTDRTAQLMVDGNTVLSNVSFPSTGSWTTWNATSGSSVSLGTGNRVIRLQATTSSGLGNIDYITVYGVNPTPVSCTGVSSASYQDNLSEADFKAFMSNVDPDLLYINYYVENETNVAVSIYNVHGQLVMVKDLGSFERGSLKYMLRLENIQPGIYFIKAYINNEVKTYKFIK